MIALDVQAVNALERRSADRFGVIFYPNPLAVVENLMVSRHIHFAETFHVCLCSVKYENALHHSTTTEVLSGLNLADHFHTFTHHVDQSIALETEEFCCFSNRTVGDALSGL